uniref:Uncharacterized protein n=1 Tax=viral metagenome TaxID=1070528 RepID=A0A6C0BM46_9ZZZZ
MTHSTNCDLELKSIVDTIDISDIVDNDALLHALGKRDPIWISGYLDFLGRMLYLWCDSYECGT